MTGHSPGAGDHTGRDKARPGAADRCPTTRALHPAADGPLARIRIPGGLLTSSQLQALADAANEAGNGDLEITSRANVQIRGVRDAELLGRILDDGGLGADPTHEKVRNILASPMSGRLSGLLDVHPLVAELDMQLRARDVLAGLPGRVLFGLDDGSGDVTSRGPDFGAHALGDRRMAIVLGGRDTGVSRDVAEVAETLLDVAAAFLDLRGDSWRVHELSGAARAELLSTLGDRSRHEPLTTPDASAPPVGWFDQRNELVTLSAGLKFGQLPARTAEFLAAIDSPIVLTPWRGVVIPDLGEGIAETVVRVLAPMGLIFDAQSPWLRVGACVGAPACANAHADVRGDLELYVAGQPEPELITPQYWCGCDRRCGHPEDAADVVAGEPGYPGRTR